MPLPGTKVFHPGWEALNRPVAKGAQTATGIVRRRSSEKTWDEVAGESVYPPPVDIYGTTAGPLPMRIVRDGVEEERRIGERQVIIRSYIVALPADAPEIFVNDEVVVSTAGDAQLPDKSLWVHDVRYGSLIWERDLVCQSAPKTQR